MSVALSFGPSLWNPLPSSLCFTLLSGSLSASLSLLKTYFYSLGLRTSNATEWSLPWAALYKFRNTIRYNTYREKVLGVVLGYASLLFHHVRHIIDSIVKLWWIVVHINNLDKNYCCICKLVIKHSIQQMIFLNKTSGASTNEVKPLFRLICVCTKFPVCNILPALIYI